MRNRNGYTDINNLILAKQMLQHGVPIVELIILVNNVEPGKDPVFRFIKKIQESGLNYRDMSEVYSA